jgi:aldehyde:ferredoxin oxidoreductase
LKWKPERHDDNPPRFYQPLSTGPYKGKTTNKKAVEEYKHRYYKAIGWDKNGVPTSKILNNLGLKDADKALARMR